MEWRTLDFGTTGFLARVKVQAVGVTPGLAHLLLRLTWKAVGEGAMHGQADALDFGHCQPCLLKVEPLVDDGVDDHSAAAFEADLDAVAAAVLHFLP